MVVVTGDEDICEHVIEFLEELELHNTLIGERLLVSAVTKVYKDPHKYKNRITGILYDELAEEFNIGYWCVERDMRTALEKAWTKNYSELHYGVYCSIISKKTGKPTAAKFIWLTAEILRNKTI